MMGMDPSAKAAKERRTEMNASPKTMRLLDRVLIGLLVLLAMLLAGLQAARATELVPSIGISRSTSGNGSTKTYGGLALRGSVLPFLKSEVAVAYRNEPFNNGNLNVRMWPVTASLWLTPLPTLYAGGGVGYYHTTLDYQDPLLQDQTSREFGTHVGGGLNFPLVPGIASVDVGGRYVHMREKESFSGPITQSFWTTTLGVAIKF